MFKEQLFKALKTAVAHYNTSNDPDDAIIKTAEQYDFNADQTKRLVETFNTAHSVDRYSNKEDGLSHFKLASADKVIVELFNPKSLGDKTPKEASVFLVDYSEYDNTEHDYVNPTSEIKIARHTYDDRDLGMTLNTGYKQIKAMEYKVRAAKEASASAKVVYDREVRSLVRSLNGEWPEKRAAILAGTTRGVIDNLGEAGLDTLKNIANLVDDTPTLNIKMGGVFDSSEFAEYIDRVEELTEIADSINSLNKSAKQLETILYSCKQAQESVTAPMYPTGLFFSLDKIAQTLFAPDGTPAVLDIEEEPEKDKEPFKPPKGPKTRDIKTTPGPITTAFNSVTKGIPDIVDSAAKMYTDRADKHVKELSEYNKVLERADVLQDLLVNDPLLSTEDPEHISKLYQKIETLVPDLARNKAIMASILRAAAQSPAIDAYDANTWLQMETRLKNLEQGSGAKKISDKD